MNLKEVDLAIVEAGMQWDPDKWDGDSWDSVDSGKSDSSVEVLSVKPVWKKEREIGCCWAATEDVVEHCTQYEIKYIIEWLK